MGSNFCDPDGSCNHRLINYYQQIAKGGCGLIILETSAANWPHGATTPNTIGFSDDRFLPGLTKLVDAVHDSGAAIAAQLNHGGKSSQIVIDENGQAQPIFIPSEVKPFKGDLFKALTVTEKQQFISTAKPIYKPMDADDFIQLIDAYTQAAIRAKKAGFDAIELHAGHGYLLSSFLSPAMNQRSDHYGGSAENRARLLCEIIDAIKQALGAKFPIIVRLDAHEFEIEGGITIDQSILHAQYAVQAGACAIDVSAYGNGLSSSAFTTAPLVHEPNGLLDFARQIAKAISVPIIAVGRITLDAAEKAIRNNEIDFVAMGRKLLADPELPHKLAIDKKSIRPCIYCYVCVSQLFINNPMRCAVNPAIGQEGQYANLISPDISKNIAVVGAGPAGMEVARLLSLRGHKVTLYEQNRQLGGTARIAALPYSPNQDLIKWQQYCLKSSSVTVKRHCQVTAETLVARQPDHIILAVGAKRQSPDITGKDQPHVFDGERLRNLLLDYPDNKLPMYQRLILSAGRLSRLLNNIDALRLISKLWLPLGKRIVLIGGGLVGLELAEFLVVRNRTITVLEPGNQLGAELSLIRRARLIKQLLSLNIQLLTDVSDIAINPKHIKFSKSGATSTLPVDSVIISLGATDNQDLKESLKLINSNIPISSIGDCHQVKYIEGAMHSAHELAVTI